MRKPIKQQPKLKQGVGDKVETVFKAVGIDKLVKFVAGEDCGCEERKQKLNELFRSKKPLCLTEDEFTYLDLFFEGNPSQVKPSIQGELMKIHARVFQHRLEPTGCAGCIRDAIKELETVLKEYKL